MTDNKVSLPKAVFKQLLETNHMLKEREYSSILNIYLSLYADGNISSFLAYIIAKCYFSMHDYPSAKEWIKKAIALEPLEKYYLLLAVVHELEYNDDSAIEIYKKVLKENPSDETALNRIVVFHSRPGGQKYVDDQFAKECLLTLINNNNDNNLSFYFLELAKIEFNNGEYSIAEELLYKAIMTLKPLSDVTLFEINNLMEKIWEAKDIM